MAARSYVAWKMVANAQAQDERNKLKSMRAKLRTTFDPVADLSETEFKNRYRFTKTVFLFLCDELRKYTNLRSTQRISLETKVS